MDEETREILSRAFPPQLIKERPGPGGKRLSYVEGHKYIERLNEAFDGDWSFEIIEQMIYENEVIVRGRLTVDGGNIVKEQYGGAEAKVTRHGEILSRADDLKAAATDALKKCSSLLGVGLHLYGSESKAHSSSPPPPSRDNGVAASEDVSESRPRPGGGFRKATERQMNAIMAMSSQIGWDTNQLRETIRAKFAKTPEGLSVGEASTFIGNLKALLETMHNKG